jgi:hypothetical protein
MKALAILPMLLATAQATPPATIDGLPLAVLPKQDLPAKGCAAFLWSASGTRALIAMATADPAQLRLSIGGAVTDLARDQQQGTGGFGFADTADYKSGDTSATLDMTIVARGDLKDGASVPEGTLRLDRTGQDSVVLPVVGLIGCA